MKGSMDRQFCQIKYFATGHYVKNIKLNLFILKGWYQGGTKPGPSALVKLKGEMVTYEATF